MKTYRLLLMILVPGVCAAQSASPDQSAAPHMVRAAGTPLNDGTLAPGMLTVRIVEGAFTRNLAGVEVRVDVAGGKVESAMTGEDGRAQFAHLPVGASIRASATAAGEQLESEIFEMPAQSGVRILLVTGGTQPATSDTGAPPIAALPVGAPAAPPSTPPSAPPSQSDTAVTVIRTVLAMTSVAAFGFFVVLRRKAR